MVASNQSTSTNQSADGPTQQTPNRSTKALSDSAHAPPCWSGLTRVDLTRSRVIGLTHPLSVGVGAIPKIIRLRMVDCPHDRLHPIAPNTKHDLTWCHHRCARPPPTARWAQLSPTASWTQPPPTARWAQPPPTARWTQLPPAARWTQPPPTAISYRSRSATDEPGEADFLVFCVQGGCRPCSWVVNAFGAKNDRQIWFWLTTQVFWYKNNRKA